MSNEVENIEDHIAFVCECGSVHFNLLKSGQIECSNCHAKRGAWSEKRKFTPEVDESIRVQNELHEHIDQYQQRLTEVELNARRYERLRILGAAPLAAACLEKGTVLRFQSLDMFIDEDIKNYQSRGEYRSEKGAGNV